MTKSTISPAMAPALSLTKDVTSSLMSGGFATRPIFNLLEFTTSVPFIVRLPLVKSPRLASA